MKLADYSLDKTRVIKDTMTWTTLSTWRVLSPQKVLRSSVWLHIWLSFKDDVWYGIFVSSCQFPLYSRSLWHDNVLGIISSIHASILDITSTCTFVGEDIFTIKFTWPYHKQPHFALSSCLLHSCSCLTIEYPVYSRLPFFSWWRHLISSCSCILWWAKIAHTWLVCCHLHYL